MCKKPRKKPPSRRDRWFFFWGAARLLYTGTGFDLGTCSGLALGLSGCEGSHAEGHNNEGCGCCDDDFFHGDSPSGGEIVNLTF